MGKLGRKPTDPIKRFQAKIRVTDSDCWEWQGRVNSWGYGSFSFKGRMMLAHRFSYEHFKEEIPTKMVVDHICRNTICVNPEHLRVLSPKENTLIGQGAPAQNARKTHCDNGHEFSPENTYIRPDGYRTCKICHRDALRRARQRRS